jgi:hypothetical protein
MTAGEDVGVGDELLAGRSLDVKAPAVDFRRSLR